MTLRQLAVCLLLVLSGCGSSSGGVICTASVEPGLRVVVTDAATELPAASGATVVVTDGDYTETLRSGATSYVEGGVGELLEYRGADERAGTYTIRVTRPGYQSFERRNVRVTENECHVNTQTVNVALTPEL